MDIVVCIHNEFGDVSKAVDPADINKETSVIDFERKCCSCLQPVTLENRLLHSSAIFIIVNGSAKVPVNHSTLHLMGVAFIN